MNTWSCVDDVCAVLVVNMDDRLVLRQSLRGKNKFSCVNLCIFCNNSKLRKGNKHQNFMFSCDFDCYLIHLCSTAHLNCCEFSPSANQFPDLQNIGNIRHGREKVLGQSLKQQGSSGEYGQGEAIYSAD